MNLVIDIGNSRIKLALFIDRELKHSFFLNELTITSIQELLDKHRNLNKLIVSTVREYPSELKTFFQNSFEHFIELGSNTLIPITNKYETPKTLGQDRLAAVIGASALFPNKNILVIDAGTAITYEIINANNEYLGGNISPGLETRFKSLNYFTGKLPIIKPSDSFNFIGTNTESAIRAGVQLGLLFELKQYINYFKNKYNELVIIITGGDAEFFDKQLKNSIFVHLNLTLIGLNRILEYNVKET